MFFIIRDTDMRLTCMAIVFIAVWGSVSDTLQAGVINIRGYDDVRTLQFSRSIYGDDSAAEQALFNSANYANWGVTGINRMPAVHTVTPANLVGVDIFFTGLLWPTSLSSSEASTLLDFVNSGGVVMGLGDRSDDFVQLQPLLTQYQMELVSPPPQGTLSILEPTHPIIDGPFGTAISLHSGDSAAFGTLPGFDGTVVANNPDGTHAIAVLGPNGAERQGAFLFFPASEQYFQNLPADHLTLFQNSIDYAIDVRLTGAVVPEPVSLSIFGFGTLGLVGLRGRRRKQTGH